MKPYLWLIPTVLLALAGGTMLATPLRFCGALCLGAAALCLLWRLLRGKKWPRRILAGLLVLGFGLFAVAETLVLSYGHKTSDEPVGAVIVLGAGVYGTVPSLSLRVRLEAALDYVADKPDIPIVVSGGQGPGEDITEAACMANWLIAHGVAEERILLEDKAMNTMENIAFSRALLHEQGVDTTGTIAVVSADYHLYRASLYYDYPYMVPVAAHMPVSWWPLTVNQYIREAFGVVRYWVLGS